MQSDASATGIPSIEALNKIWLASRRELGKGCSIVIFSPGSNQKIILEVKSFRSRKEPTWFLYAPYQSGHVLLQSISSSDLSKVHNLIINAFLEENAKLSLKSQMSEETKGIGQKLMIFAGSSVKSNRRSARDTCERLAPAVDGDLTALPITSLLQAFSMSKVTGCLTLSDSSTRGEIYFADGLPVHAAVGLSIGDLAMLELICWEFGEFHFENGERSEYKTVKKRLDFLLMSAVTLIDQFNELKAVGIEKNCVIEKASLWITDADFKQAINSWKTCNVDNLRRFYDSVTDGESVKDATSRVARSRAQWVPLLYGVWKSDLIRLVVKDYSAETKHVSSTLRSGLKHIDVVQQLETYLRSPETELFRRQIFTYVLSREFEKRADHKLPFSLLLLQISPCLKRHSPEPFKKKEIMRSLNKRLVSLKRSSDIVAEFENNEIAVLLYDADSMGCASFLKRLFAILKMSAGPIVCDGHEFNLRCGVACVPEDATNLDELIEMAKRSLKVVAKAQMESELHVQKTTLLNPIHAT